MITAAEVAKALESCDWSGAPIGNKAIILQAVELLRAQQAEPVALSVWFGDMPETNGKKNWTAILHRKNGCISEGVTLTRSEYPDRVRYEADRVRYLIGELKTEPDILAYDGDLHSGHVPKRGAQPPAVPTLSAALADIAAERRRQIEAEGWTPEHDDAYQEGPLADAAACYALCAHDTGAKRSIPAWWPWRNEWWKPTTARRDLVKAGALIAAEIERLDRAAQKGGEA